jgi:DNA/RNA endonuclease YhcR with UshA esterase domain
MTRNMQRIRWFALPILVGLFALPTFGQKKYSPSEAKEHFGETATVCGEVVSTRYADSTKGQPTFLNLDKPYPNQIFTVVIWGNNRSKFGTPENDFKGKRICVTGKITAYAGLPEIVADEPKQITHDSSR